MNFILYISLLLRLWETQRQGTVYVVFIVFTGAYLTKILNKILDAYPENSIIYILMLKLLS